MKQVGGLTGVRGERPLPGIRQFNNFQDGHIRRWSTVVVVGAHHSVSRDFFLTDEFACTYVRRMYCEIFVRVILRVIQLIPKGVNIMPYE